MLLDKDAPQLLSGVNPPVELKQADQLFFIWRSSGSMQRSCRITELGTLRGRILSRDLISAESVRDVIPSAGSAPAGSQVKVGRGLDWRTGSCALWLSSVNRCGARQSWAVWGRYEVWWMINAKKYPTLIIVSAATDCESEFCLPRGNFSVFFSALPQKQEAAECSSVFIGGNIGCGSSSRLPWLSVFPHCLISCFLWTTLPGFVSQTWWKADELTVSPETSAPDLFWHFTLLHRPFYDHHLQNAQQPVLKNTWN